MEENLKQIYSSPNEIDILQVISILKDNNIPFIRKDSGSGSYLSISMGQSFQEKTIYVDENDYSKALSLIGTITVDENSSNLINEELIGEESNLNYSKKFTYIKKILAFLLLGLPILIILILIIFAFISK